MVNLAVREKTIENLSNRFHKNHLKLLILKLCTNYKISQHLHDLNTLVTLIVLLLKVKPYF